jgi:hypothetical protein
VAASWCKVASNLDSHPKIRKAGRNGREVFLFALRRNAEPGNPIPGQIGADELDPDYLSDMLLVTRDEAVTGVTAAVTAGLLRKTDAGYLIVGFDQSWGRTGSSGRERTAKWRESKKAEKSVTDVTSRDVTESHGDARDAGEERRGEEDPPLPLLHPADKALATQLVLKVIANHPGNKLTKLTPAKKTETIVKWANHVRLMREVDKHTADEIKAVIDWCQSDPFWRKNVLSTEKLREKWDQLVAQMGNKAPRPKSRPSPDQPPLEFQLGDMVISR